MAVVDERSCEEMLGKVVEGFYAKRGRENALEERMLFACAPGEGAAVLA